MKKTGCRRMSGLLLAIIILVSCIIRPSVAYGAEEAETRTSVMAEAREQAVQWLQQQQTESGSFGSSVLVNDTCMAVWQLEQEGIPADSDWLKTQAALEENQNTDIWARVYCASRDNELLQILLENQNPDGGYGLTVRYESDAWDSMLALEAFVHAGKSEIPEEACDTLIRYIASIQQEDGGFAYVSGMPADIELTMRIGIAVNCIQNQQMAENEQLEAILNKTDAWLAANILQAENAEADFEQVAYRSLYLLQRGRGKQIEGDEAWLLELQGEDGSWNENINDTVLGIRLLRAFEDYYQPYVKISETRTSLSAYTAVTDRQAEITVTTKSSYEINYDTELIWRILLCEGENQTELWNQSAELKEDGTLLELEQTVTFVPEEEKEYELRTELLWNQSIVAEAQEKLHTIKLTEEELVLEGKAVEGEDYTVSLSWNDITNEQYHYGYRIYRRTDGGEWETRSAWNAEEVRVLNIYPCNRAKNYLVDWMTEPLSDEDIPAGQNLFEIDTVHIDDYNAAPEQYLMDEEGNYQYDVLFFGSYDSNGFKDLSEEAYNATQDYVDSGRGVLFGHDTVCLRGMQSHPQFARFADQMGIRLGTISTDQASSNVRVVNSGFLTSYPWKIEGDITVPATHTLGQFTGGTLEATVWMELDKINATDDETGGVSNAYLFTHNQLAMIQTGHSNGQATDDERKVLANTLFYLKQLTHETEAVDHSAYDTEKPEVQQVGTAVIAESGEVEIELQGCDYGTQYEYYVEALAEGDSENEYRQESDVVAVEMTSGIRGFIVGISNSDAPMEELVVHAEDGTLASELVIAEDGVAVYTCSSQALEEDTYLHIYAVDYAGNISGETVTKLETAEEQPEEPEQPQEPEVPETPEEPAGYFHTGYALFSEEDTVMYCSSAGLYGSSYVGTGMTFGGSSLQSTGAVQTTGTITAYAGSVDMAERTEQGEAAVLPDYRETILAGIQSDGAVEELALWDSTTIQNPVYCQGTTGAYCPELGINADVFSENTIQFHAGQVTAGGEEKVVVCSAHGDINIYATSLTGSGCIYAPEGTVTINVSQLEFRGSIIARRICIQGDSIRIGEEME